MTLRGAERLRQELKQLKSEARPNVIKAIAEARSHGDLSENAEYHAAREQQSFIEGRINDIEGRLSNAEVIDVTKLTANGRVVFGSTVEVEDQVGGAKLVYQLVGDDEADIKKRHALRLLSDRACLDRQIRGRRGRRDGAGRHAQLRDRVRPLRLIGARGSVERDPQRLPHAAGFMGRKSLVARPLGGADIVLRAG